MTSRTLAALAFVAGSTLGLHALGCPGIEGQRGVEVQPAKPSTVQIALLLDTSGSMDGLIEQAKTQLWSVVNQFAVSSRCGVRPKLQVALYHYGNDTLSPGEGFVQMLLPLTDDLDAVSEKLFSLRTNGGSEFCGTVIDKATRELAWSSEKSDLKIIVIAGNEPFTQGETDYKASVPLAAKKNIIVNTIFCGDRAEGERTNWKDGAVLGEGAYSNIDQNATMPMITTPQDEELTRLGAELNTTYVAYGLAGESGRVRQAAQDSNAANAAPAAAAERAVSKASGLYQNSSWDLVDAIKNKQVQLKDVKETDLPEEMNKMTPAQREDHVKALTAKREETQGKIRELEAKRQTFITEERRKQAGSAQAATLGDALLTSIRDQAAKLEYKFEKPAQAEGESKK